jgi:uncharacterized membrane protein
MDFSGPDPEIPRSVALSSVTTSLVVALLALAFSFMAFRAYAKRGNSAMQWVGVAFLVFALRNLFSAFNIWTEVVKHGTVELILSLFDLALMLILMAPLLFRRRT